MKSWLYMILVLVLAACAARPPERSPSVVEDQPVRKERRPER